MFKNELVVMSIKEKPIVYNRYLNSNFWHKYGFKHFRREMFGGNGYTSILDTYGRYTNTAHGKVYQTISIAYDKWESEPARINGFLIDTYDDRWRLIVSYNSYKPGVKKWTC